jgi:hypothetical protein
LSEAAAETPNPGPLNLRGLLSCLITGMNEKENNMKKILATVNREAYRLTRGINRSAKHFAKIVTRIWQAHQELMSKNPSYRELLDLAITTGIRLLRLSPAITLAVSVLLASFTERNQAWE